ncbi:MAG: Ig-like domain-containing protein, partial [Halobacteriota archaeon]
PGSNDARLSGHPRCRHIRGQGDTRGRKARLFPREIEFTVTITDGNDVPSKGETVTVEGTEDVDELGGIEAGDTAKTDDDGEATFTATSVDPGEFTVEFSEPDAGTDTATATFESGAPDEVRLVADPGDETVTADGEGVISYTVTVLDARVNPVNGVDVVADGSEGTAIDVNGEGDTATATTDSTGRVEFAVASTDAQADVGLTFTEQTENNDATAEATFEADEPAELDVEVTETEATADGTDEVEFTATVTDANDNPVPGVQVLTTDDGTDVDYAGDDDQVTDENGEVTITATSTTVQDDVTFSFTEQDLKHDATAEAAFEAGAPDSINATVTDDEATANGTDEVEFTVTVEDAHANPIEGVQVETTDDGEAIHYDGDDGQVTDEDGEVTITATSTTAQDDVTFSFEEQVQNHDATAEATFEAGVPTSLVVENTTETAGEAGEILVVLEDEFENPVPDETVGVVDAAGIDGLDGATVDTDENGEAAFAFAEGIADDYDLVFEVAVDSSFETTSTVTVEATDPDSLSVDDVTQTTGESSELTATLVDEFGNEIADEDVEVTDADGLGGIADGDTADTDENGEASFDIDEDDAGIYTVEFELAADDSITDTATVTIETDVSGGSGGGDDRPQNGENDDDEFRIIRGDVDDETRFEVIAGNDDEVTLDVRGDDGDSDDESDGDESTTGEPDIENVAVDSISIRPTKDGQRDFDVIVREWSVDLGGDEPGEGGQGGTGESNANGDDTSEASDGANDRAHPRAFLEDTGASAIGYVEVNHTNPDADIEHVTFRFRVHKTYLNETGVGTESVALYRDETDRWNELDAKQVDETGEYHIFEATSPGLSLFTVGSTRPVFDVDEVKLGRQDVDVGETVTVDATVRNLGGADGTHEVVLSADGERVTSAEVSVEARSTETVGLSFEPREAGEYDLLADDEAVGVVSVEAVNDEVSSEASGVRDALTDDTTGDSRESDGGSPEIVLVVGLLAAALLALFAVGRWRRRTEGEQEDPGGP